MTKKVITIISVLKPIDDTRNFEKIARSLSNTNEYDINIIGFSTINIPSDQKITFHPIFNFNRASIKRLWASVKIGKKLLELKPELIIVTAAELLPVSLMFKILFGTKIIYDIQENYYRNIIYTNTYPAILRYPVALLLRAVEIVSSSVIDYAILAEKIYQIQMRYLSAKVLIIDNKALIPSQLKNLPKIKSDKIVMVYSGTIAEHYGIFDAVNFIKRLKTKVKNIVLIIIGFAAQGNVYQKLLKSIEGLDYITIIGGATLVPHDQILMQMKGADFCLLPYKKNKSTEGRIPTKLYECLAMEIPVIIAPNPAWDTIIDEYNAGILFDFNADTEIVIQNLNETYYGKSLSSDFEWGSSADRLLKMIHRVI